MLQRFDRTCSFILEDVLRFHLLNVQVSPRPVPIVDFLKSISHKTCLDGTIQLRVLYTTVNTYDRDDSMSSVSRLAQQCRLTKMKFGRPQVAVVRVHAVVFGGERLDG